MTDDIQQQLNELKAKHAELDARYKKAEDAKKSTPEYNELEARLKVVQKEEHILYEKSVKLGEKIRLNFTDDGHYPYYSKSSNGWGKRTNIHEHVLQAIRSQVKISLLTQDEIKYIVNELIKRAEKKTELDEIREQREKLNNEESTIRDKKRLFGTSEMKNLEHEKYLLYVQINKIEFAIKNPKIVKAQSDRYAEREKARRSTTIDAIEKYLKGD